jgi:hypothetical protein
VLLAGHPYLAKQSVGNLVSVRVAVVPEQDIGIWHCHFFVWGDRRRVGEVPTVRDREGRVYTERILALLHENRHTFLFFPP